VGKICLNRRRIANQDLAAVEEDNHMLRVQIIAYQKKRNQP